MKGLRTALVYGAIIAVTMAMIELISFGAIAFLARQPGNGSLASHVERFHPLFRPPAKQGNIAQLGNRGDADNPYVFDSRLSYRNRIGVKFTETLPIGPHGFICNARCEDFPRAKPEGELRVMLFGGSSVAGFGPGITGADTISAQMEAALQPQVPGKRVRVINAGVGGWFSGQELTLLALEALSFQPDMVVFLDGFNDGQQWISELTNKPRLVELKDIVLPNTHYYGYSLITGFERVQSMGGAVAHTLSLASQHYPVLYYTAALAKHARRMSMGAAAADVKDAGDPAAQQAIVDGFAPRLDDLSINSVATYAANLRSAAGIAASHRIPGLFVLQPGAHHAAKAERTATEAAFVDPARMRVEDRMTLMFFQAAARRFAGLATENGRWTRYLDLTGLFAAEREPVWSDDIHYTAHANRLIAAALSRQVTDMLDKAK
jgi:lysophospholipase L1-like esterase